MYLWKCLKHQPVNMFCNRVKPTPTEPLRISIAEIMSPVGCSDRSRFKNIEVVCMLQIEDSRALEVSEVNVRALSLAFSLVVSLSQSLISLGHAQSKFDMGSQVATSKPFHLMRNLF